MFWMDSAQMDWMHFKLLRTYKVHTQFPAAFSATALADRSCQTFKTYEFGQSTFLNYIKFGDGRIFRLLWWQILGRVTDFVAWSERPGHNKCCNTDWDGCSNLAREKRRGNFAATLFCQQPRGKEKKRKRSLQTTFFFLIEGLGWASQVFSPIPTSRELARGRWRRKRRKKREKEENKPIFLLSSLFRQTYSETRQYFCGN